MTINAAPVSIIGMGEVGRRLAGALATAGVNTVPVTRQSGWEEALAHPRGLLAVCVREEALAEVVELLRGLDPRRLVFAQNGWIRPLLAEFKGCTRGLVWFTSKGEFFRALRPSIFSGARAKFLASALERGGISSEAVDEGTFAAAEAEKMGFNCVVGLPLAVHGVSLSEYLERHRDEAQAVFTEAASVTARATGAATSAGWWDDFVRLAEPIGWVRASAAKALEYRNGAVVRLARELKLAAPVNERLLAAIGMPTGS
jgi:ketopantoate reductase